MLGFDTFYVCAEFNDSSSNRARDIIWAPKFKVGHVTLTMHLLRVICHQYAETWHNLLCTKFDHRSFSHFRDMVDAHQILNGSRNLTTTLAEMICHPWDSTWYDQSTYQIPILYLHPLRGYERRYKIPKMGWFKVVRGQSWSLNIAPFDTARTSSFLLAFLSNCVSILHRFWDIAGYLSKIAYM